MRFGLKNVSISFEGYINQILAEKQEILMIINLNNIPIDTEDCGQSHVNVICWVLEQVKKHGFFADLEKCGFHQDWVCFLESDVSSQSINMKKEQIKAVKAWLRPRCI